MQQFESGEMGVRATLALRTSGQPLRHHAEGGGTITFEFPDSDTDAMVALMRRARGHRLDSLFVIIPAETAS